MLGCIKTSLTLHIKGEIPPLVVLRGPTNWIVLHSVFVLWPSFNFRCSNGSQDQQNHVSCNHWLPPQTAENPPSLLAFWFLDYSLGWQLVWFSLCFAFHSYPTLFDIMYSVSPSSIHIHNAGQWKQRYYKIIQMTSLSTQRFPWQQLQFLNGIYSFIFLILIKDRKLLNLVWLRLMTVSSWTSRSHQEIQTVN